MKEYLIKFDGKQLGSIMAESYDDAKKNIGEVITIEEVEE